MVHFKRWCFMLMLSIGALATVDTDQQNSDCKFGGDNVEHYREQFRENNIRYGVDFDDFCITEDLETSKCCIDENTEGVIADYKVYEILTWGLPITTSPSGTKTDSIKWGLRASPETPDPYVKLFPRCLQFDWKKVMKNLTFGKVELTVQYPGNDTRNLIYISDIHDTPYSVWVPTPPIDIKIFNESLSVSLEEGQELQYDFWQLCICVQDGASRKCELDPLSLYSYSRGWTRSLAQYKSNALQVCVGFSFSSYTGTFGPNRTCENIAVDKSAMNSESWTFKSVGYYWFTMVVTPILVIILLYLFYKLICQSNNITRWVSRLKLCRGKPQTIPVGNPGDGMDRRPEEVEPLYEDIDYRYVYTDILGGTEMETHISNSTSDSQTDSGLSSGLSNAQGEGFMYQAVPQTALYRTTPRHQDTHESYQPAGHSEQEYSSTEPCLGQNRSDSIPHISQEDTDRFSESNCYEDGSVDDIYNQP